MSSSSSTAEIKSDRHPRPTQPCRNHMIASKWEPDHFGTQPFWHHFGTQNATYHQATANKPSNFLTGATLWKPRAFQSDPSTKKRAPMRNVVIVFRSMSPSATPATQNQGRCHQAPRLPHKLYVANPDSNNGSTFQAFGGWGGVRVQDCWWLTVKGWFLSCANPEKNNGSTF